MSEIWDGSKKIQTGIGIAQIKFTGKGIEFHLANPTNPNNGYDWEQVSNALVEAAHQACAAAKHGVDNYWDTQGISAN